LNQYRCVADCSSLPNSASLTANALNQVCDCNFLSYGFHPIAEECFQCSNIPNCKECSYDVPSKKMACDLCDSTSELVGGLCVCKATTHFIDPSTSTCQTCANYMPNCKTDKCLNAGGVFTGCSECLDNTKFLENGVCKPCSEIDLNCAQCGLNSNQKPVCTQCNVNFMP